MIEVIIKVVLCIVIAYLSYILWLIVEEDEDE